MNELKPEDVMRALDILDKMDFFQGQRAGRELWFEKPFEVQEQDIADFSQGIEFVKNLIADADALALLREKDAEIERLTKERDDARRDCAIAEQNHYECKKELEEMSDDILDSVRAERDRYKAESEQYQSALLKRCAEHEYDYSRGWNEAITEFAERLKRFYSHLVGKTVGGSVEYHINQILKEMKGENNDGNQN